MANKYWVGAGASFNSIYWSLTSGGSSGAGVPDSLDTALYDRSSGSCAVDASTTLGNLTLCSDYTATITYTYPIFTNSLSLAGGLLTTSDRSIHVYGDVSCIAGFGNYSPTNNAIIAMEGSWPQTVVTLGGILPHLVINNDSTFEVSVAGTGDLFFNGDLVINDGTFNSSGHNLALLGTPSNLYQPPSSFNVDFTWGIMPSFNVDFTWGVVPIVSADFSWDQIFVTPE